ncbi:head GIN domain-containing protein [Flavobacterium sp. 3HN19-14]|uniref:head GIN domain-containing protein n=1 Tax=Flavobacterium sp. 3HN19-14 TaxID=3448133 RepID=UPI003EDEBC12
MIKTIIYLTKIAIVTAFALLFASCNYNVNFGDGIKGSGKITSQTRTINGDFTKVHVSDGIQVIITQSTDKSVTVEADDNILQHIKTRVEDGVLVVESDESYNTEHTPNVTIKMPVVSELVSEAGSNITGTNTIVTGDIKVSSESGSNIEVEVEADHIVAGTESGSQMRLRGKALKLDISSESGSSMDAGNLRNQRRNS